MENAVSLFLPSLRFVPRPVLPRIRLVSLPPVAMYALLRPQLNAAAQREEKEEEGRSGKGITQAANLNAFYIALFMQAPSFSLPLPPSRSHVSTSKKGRTRRREQARGAGGRGRETESAACHSVSSD